MTMETSRTRRQTQAMRASILSVGRWLLEVGSTFCAMCGFRIEHLNLSWVLGGVASFALYASERGNVAMTLAHFSSALVFYYVGNTLILTSTLPARLVRRYGEEDAFRIYETVLGLMFFNIILAAGAMSAFDLGPSMAWPIPVIPTYALGGLLIGTGLVTKLWSTAVVGIDIYYYRDMFLGRKVSDFVSSGPYTVFPNPMYGIGQLHGYGFALLSRSVPGLIAVVVCQTLIFVFCLVVEKPFVRRTYFSPAVPV